MRPTLAHEVDRLPPRAEWSIEALADYVVSRQPDPWLELKAFHDWMLSRMTQDAGGIHPLQWRVLPPHRDAEWWGLVHGNRVSTSGRRVSSCYFTGDVVPDGELPIACPERNETGLLLLDPGVHVRASSVVLMPDVRAVFRSRRGNSSDFAALFAALGRAAMLDVVVVEGRTHSLASSPLLAGRIDEVIREQAWNVAKIGGEERPVDVSWDAAECGWGACTTFRTDWLFTPPEVFARTHVASADPARF
jgi:transglutaminase/protease-like cytokinesis protein 3